MDSLLPLSPSQMGRHSLRGGEQQGREEQAPGLEVSSRCGKRKQADSTVPGGFLEVAPKCPRKPLLVPSTIYCLLSYEGQSQEAAWARMDQFDPGPLLLQTRPWPFSGSDGGDKVLSDRCPQRGHMSSDLSTASVGGVEGPCRAQALCAHH